LDLSQARAILNRRADALHQEAFIARLGKIDWQQRLMDGLPCKSASLNVSWDLAVLRRMRQSNWHASAAILYGLQQ